MQRSPFKMRTLFPTLLVLNFLLLACGKSEEKEEEDAEGAPSVAEQKLAATELRALSYALRDAPPTREEAMSFASGQLSKADLIAAMIDSPDHQERVGRFFHDAFGTHAYPEALFGQKALIRDAQGWYQSSDGFPQCTTLAQMQNIEVWWGSSGQTVPVCSLAACGDYALNCALVSHRPQLMDAIRYEFRDRGLFVYNEGLSWNDLYAGKFFYGNRHLLHKYILDSSIASGTSHVYQASAQNLRSLVDFMFQVPLDKNIQLELPKLGPERAGLVTSPAFMQRFNNFRSRVRALSIGLLCQDVGAWMNPTGMTEFVNKSSLTAFDLSHGNKAACASCHLGMDNWGSTLLGWSDQGNWQWWKTWSQLGAMQGVEGTGPSFLMENILNQQQPFNTCMAQKAWQSFSQGRPWEHLSEMEREQLIQAVPSDPRAFLRTLFSLDSLILNR